MGVRYDRPCGDAAEGGRKDEHECKMMEDEFLNGSITRSQPLDILRQKLYLFKALDGFKTPSTSDHGDDTFDNGHDNLV
ncbi:MAG: hypothetical protein TREMPRED_000207, partial [Tremellales sp. Tagirdzhanova-0007]